MVLRAVVEGQAGLPVPNSTLSYWHTQPSSLLKGYRSSPELPKHVDTVVVGTGMTGSFAARFLKEANPASRLLVLEAREACWGATGRNGGHCQPFLYGTSEDVARFELETYWFLRGLVEREGVPCDFRPVHGVHTMLTQDVFDAAVEAVPRLKARVPDFADKLVIVGPEGVVGGHGPCDWAEGMTLKSLRIDRPGVKGAIVQKYAASMWPYKLVCWVLEQLVAAHGPDEFNLQTNTPVTSVSRSSEEEEEGGRKWVVQTPRGQVTASQVLLATNGYTSRLLPAFADLIVPVRGQISALLPPEPRVALDYSYVFFGKEPDHTTRDEYLVQRPLPGGELILGGGRNVSRRTVGEWRDDEIEPEVAAYLGANLEPVLDLGRGRGGDGHGDAPDGLPASIKWTGIMGFSRDQAPWVGRVPEALGGAEGLFMASGFTGHGMPRCALAGRGVARMMTGDQDAHGLPKSFVASEDRAAEARGRWGPVGTVDEMDTLLADLKGLEDVTVSAM